MISELQLSAIVDEAGYGSGEIIAVAVLNEDGSVTRQSRGLLPDGRPMSTSMQVYGASQTKQLIAMCAAQLVRDGRLDPEAPISTWFPELPSWGNEIRFRHLVNHTPGLPLEETLLTRMGELGLDRRTSDAMLDAVATFPELTAPPGETFQYCNVGYVAMGRIIELITGTPLIDYLDAVVFKPLGMGQSRLWQGPGPHPAGANPLDPEKPIPHSLGDGGMWTTADDFTKWIAAMNADYFRVRELMTTTGTFNNGDRHDYAWGLFMGKVGDGEVASHGGAWYGSVSKSSWIPARGTGFIAFTITGGDVLNAVSAAILELLTAP